jgi:hypothetical protein
LQRFIQGFQTHDKDNVHLSQIRCVTMILYRNIMFNKVILHLNCNNEVLKKKKQLQIRTTLNSLREPKKQHPGFDPEKILKI